jgi:hypothetical protein
MTERTNITRIFHQGEEMIRQVWTNFRSNWLLGSEAKEEAFLRPLEQHKDFLEYFSPDF